MVSDTTIQAMTEEEEEQALCDSTANALAGVISLCLFTWTPAQLVNVLQGYIDDLEDVIAETEDEPATGSIQ